MRKKSKRFSLQRFRSSGIIVETRTIRCIRGGAAKLVKAAERPRGETHSGNSIGQLPWSVWHCPVRSRNATCSSASLPPVAGVSLCRSGSFRPVAGCYRSNKPRQEFPPVSTFDPPRVFSVSSSARRRSFFSFVHHFSLPLLAVWHFLFFLFFFLLLSRGRRNSRLLPDGQRRCSFRQSVREQIKRFPIAIARGKRKEQNFKPKWGLLMIVY